jgi:hypothetical protein
VGQTGTLTRLTENIGDFNPSFAMKLSRIAKQYGAGLKEHNGDYLSDAVLAMHPGLGVTSVNVAPEYGVAETAAYLSLVEMEKEFYELGMITAPSLFINALRTETIKTERWRKWLVGENAGKPLDAVLSDKDLADLIVRVGGHYSFEIPAVKREMGIMLENLSALGINPRQFVIDSVKRSIGRYVDCFNLEGLTGKIRKVLESKQV